jgi:hypothetical protein
VKWKGGGEEGSLHIAVNPNTRNIHGEMRTCGAILTE